MTGTTVIWVSILMYFLRGLLCRTFTQSAADGGRSVPLSSGAHGVHFCRYLPRSGTFCTHNYTRRWFKPLSTSYHAGFVQLRSHRQRMERHQSGRLPLEDSRSDALPIFTLSPVPVLAHVRPIVCRLTLALQPNHPPPITPNPTKSSVENIHSLWRMGSASDCHNNCRESLLCVVLFCSVFFFQSIIYSIRCSMLC